MSEEEEDKKIIEEYEKEMEEIKKQLPEDKIIDSEAKRCKFCHKEMKHFPASYISQDEFNLGRFELWECIGKCGFKIIEVFDNYSKLEYSEIQKYFGDKKKRITRK